MEHSRQIFSTWGKPEVYRPVFLDMQHELRYMTFEASHSPDISLLSLPLNSVMLAGVPPLNTAANSSNFSPELGSKWYYADIGYIIATYMDILPA